MGWPVTLKVPPPGITTIICDYYKKSLEFQNKQLHLFLWNPDRPYTTTPNTNVAKPKTGVNTSLPTHFETQAIILKIWSQIVTVDHGGGRFASHIFPASAGPVTPPLGPSLLYSFGRWRFSSILTSSPNLLRNPTNRFSTQGTSNAGVIRITSTSGTPNTWNNIVRAIESSSKKRRILGNYCHLLTHVGNNCHHLYGCFKVNWQFLFKLGVNWIMFYIIHCDVALLPSFNVMSYSEMIFFYSSDNQLRCGHWFEMPRQWPRSFGASYFPVHS